MKGLSIRISLVGVAAMAALAGCVAIAGVSAHLVRIERDQALLEHAQSVADRLQLSPGNGVEVLVGGDQSVVAAVVFSPSGEVAEAFPPNADLEPLRSALPVPGGQLREMTVSGSPAVAVPVSTAAGGRAWILLDAVNDASAQRRRLVSWAAAGVVALAIAVLIALLVGNSLATAQQRIRETLGHIGDGDFDARCDQPGRFGLREIAEGVNLMASKLEATIDELGDERRALEQQVSGRTRELEQANRLLMDIANRDALTGLANRRRLEMELERNISFSKRTGQPLAVIMMDLDKFKICNDTAGHLVGDNILRAVASTLRSRVRVTDLVVRWGGDEFCILVPATQPEGAVAAAEGLVDAVREATGAIALPAPLEPPTASAGVACFPDDGEDPHTLVRNADAALYQVKATGRGRVLRYSPEFSHE